jgi:hypothetical protein
MINWQRIKKIAKGIILFLVRELLIYLAIIISISIIFIAIAFAVHIGTILSHM